ncbi:hypothetical protein [Streptomyces sp. NPDC001843]|uniref:hypothetical protein n=1 Tax=Streptomyces sp. NPDC001843 TaxID=3364617 RepID=UPI0036AB752E
MGTMFFVAESMTASQEEFALGVECFLRADSRRALRRRIREREVYESLVPFADDVRTMRLRSSAAVREGYSGMIFACGRRNAE